MNCCCEFVYRRSFMKRNHCILYVVLLCCLFLSWVGITLYQPPLPQPITEGTDVLPMQQVMRFSSDDILPNCCKFSPDGGHIYVAPAGMRQDEVAIVDVASGKEVSRVRGSPNQIEHTSFIILAPSPDGRYLYLSGSGPYIRRFDVTSGGSILFPLTCLPSNKTLGAMTLSQDGSFLYAVPNYGEQMIKMDTKTGQQSIILDLDKQSNGNPTGIAHTLIRRFAINSCMDKIAFENDAKVFILDIPSQTKTLINATYPAFLSIRSDVLIVCYHKHISSYTINNKQLGDIAGNYVDYQLQTTGIADCGSIDSSGRWAVVGISKDHRVNSVVNLIDLTKGETRSSFECGKAGFMFAEISGDASHIATLCSNRELNIYNSSSLTSDR